VEIYFNDCYDLLNKKAKVAITGFGQSNKTSANLTRANAEFSKDGKWISPYEK
jgi:hypothetical protein